MLDREIGFPRDFFDESDLEWLYEHYPPAAEFQESDSEQAVTDLVGEDEWWKHLFGAVHTAGGLALSAFGLGSAAQQLGELESKADILPEWNDPHAAEKAAARALDATPPMPTPSSPDQYVPTPAQATDRSAALAAIRQRAAEIKARRSAAMNKPHVIGGEDFAVIVLGAGKGPAVKPRPLGRTGISIIPKGAIPKNAKQVVPGKKPPSAKAIKTKGKAFNYAGVVRAANNSVDRLSLLANKAIKVASTVPKVGKVRATKPGKVKTAAIKASEIRKADNRVANAIKNRTAAGTRAASAGKAALTKAATFRANVQKYAERLDKARGTKTVVHGDDARLLGAYLLGDEVLGEMLWKGADLTGGSGLAEVVGDQLADLEKELASLPAIPEMPPVGGETLTNDEMWQPWVNPSLDAIEWKPEHGNLAGEVASARFWDTAGKNGYFLSVDGQWKLAVPQRAVPGSPNAPKVKFIVKDPPPPEYGLNEETYTGSGGNGPLVGRPGGPMANIQFALADGKWFWQARTAPARATAELRSAVKYLQDERKRLEDEIARVSKAISDKEAADDKERIAKDDAELARQLDVETKQTAIDEARQKREDANLESESAREDYKYNVEQQRADDEYAREQQKLDLEYQRAMQEAAIAQMQAQGSLPAGATDDSGIPYEDYFEPETGPDADESEWELPDSEETWSDDMQEFANEEAAQDGELGPRGDPFVPETEE